MKEPWVVRQDEEISGFSGVIEKKFRNEIKSVKKEALNDIIEKATARKKYDIYHSTTIEGYRITPDEVEAVIFGKEGAVEEGAGEKLKNKMAILGHGEAFDFVLSRIEADFGRARISEDLISEIYFRLFKPSADAGIIDRLDLVGYRKVKVFIRGSRFVPPSFEKVPALIQSYVNSISAIENRLIQAILAHFFFVTIHPYFDGNGRCARLLMNYLLSASGFPWLTITFEKRDAYFSALQSGQLDRDIIPFAGFILSMLAEKE